MKRDKLKQRTKFETDIESQVSESSAQQHSNYDIKNILCKHCSQRFSAKEDFNKHLLKSYHLSYKKTIKFLTDSQQQILSKRTLKRQGKSPSPIGIMKKPSQPPIKQSLAPKQQNNGQQRVNQLNQFIRQTRSQMKK